MATISDLMKVHRVIDDLFYEHQRALLHFDFASAASCLVAYRSILVNHMRDEEDFLLPVYAKRATYPAAGAPKLYLDEHARMLSHVGLFERTTADLGSAAEVERPLLDLLAREGAAVAHCPSSNLKLANGIAPTAAFRAKGITMGLGTDGAASNNRLDLLGEMRTASLLAKGASGNARALGAHEVLRIATLEGARALGLEREIGSLVPGKQADLAAVELSSLETLPCFDPVSDLIHSAGREHVTHVWVAGVACLADRQLTRLDAEDIRAKAAWWRRKIRNGE